MNTPKLIALFLAVFAITSHAANSYIITANGSSRTQFNATKNGVAVGTANQSMETVINAIRTNNNGTAGVAIQFENGTDILYMETCVTFDGSTSPGWGGTITLTGKIAATRYCSNSISLVNGASISSTADIENHGDGYGSAVNNDGTGTVTISGGTVSAGRNYAVNNNGTGTVTISGGTVSGVYNNGEGTVTISDGTVSANSNSTSYAVYNRYNGTVTISGGTVTSNNSNAVYSAGYSGKVILGKSPTITGAIFMDSNGSGQIEVIAAGTDAFNPSDKVYSFLYESPSTSTVAVKNAGNYLANFAYSPSDNFTLIKDGNDIKLQKNNYSVSRSGTTYTIARETAGTYTTAQLAIGYIRTQANGQPCTIQFGSGGNVLNIDNENITFNGAAPSPAWGAITLAGKITSATSGEIITNSASISSTADIANTNYNGRAVYNEGTGTVTISGGTVSATSSSYAVRNAGAGTVTIIGGTVSGYNAVDNTGTGTVTISGGTVSATSSSGYAVYNTGTGTVTISGGTVSATSSSGYAVRNQGAGTVAIIGGTVTVSTSNNNANGTIIRWNTTAPKTYTAFTNNDITRTPTTATAKWLNKDGKAGIDYANANNTVTGFIPVEGVIVNKATPTVTIWPTATTIIYGAALSSSGLSGGNGAGTFAWTIGTIIPTVTNSGYSVTFTPTDAANYNTITQNVAITVNKAPGLENDAPPKRYISAVNTNENTYELHLLAFNKSDHGDLSYAPGTLEDPDGILASTYPKIANKILTYKGSGKTSGEAKQKITVTSENYADIEVTITFEATAKEEVTISGITAQNSVYDGNPKLGYAGTPASGDYTGALLIEYAGTNHPQSTTRPTNAGEYTVKISVPDSATYYFGLWTDDFTISKKQIAKPTVTNTNLVYTGGEQSAGIAANAAYTVTGGKGTNANTYTATVALNDKDNYEWEDGETDDILLPWAIAANTPILPQIATGSIRVQATANAITLENLPKNTKVQIYSLQGKQIYSANSDNSQILRIPVQTKGMYVVKAGSQTVRVAVR